MKFTKLMFMALFSVFAFTSCKNDKKTENMNSTEGMQVDSTVSEMKETEKESMNTDMQSNEDTLNLAEVAMKNSEFTTLVSAMQSAGLVAKLTTNEPYTIFAPTNSAFNDLPKGTIEDLMEPKNKEKLEAALSYHIIPGNVDAAKLRDLIKNSNNSYTLVTANDGELKATINDAGNIILIDGRGKKSTITDADQRGSNGVIHSINSVLMRK